MAQVFLSRTPFDRFDQYIPAEATGFSVNSFVDLGILYHAVLDFIAQAVPDGTQYIEKWNGLLAQIGFDPDRDLFSWWSGEMIHIELPASVVMPMGGGKDGVLLIRVRDSQKAAQKVGAAVRTLMAKSIRGRRR